MLLLKRKKKRRNKIQQNVWQQSKLDHFSNNPTAFIKPSVEKSTCQLHVTEEIQRSYICAALQPFKSVHPKTSEQTNSLINTVCAPQLGGFSAPEGLDSGPRVRQVPTEKLPVSPPPYLPLCVPAYFAHTRVDSPVGV